MKEFLKYLQLMTIMGSSSNWNVSSSLTLAESFQYSVLNSHQMEDTLQSLATKMWYCLMLQMMILIKKDSLKVTQFRFVKFNLT